MAELWITPAFYFCDNTISIFPHPFPRLGPSHDIGEKSIAENIKFSIFYLRNRGNGMRLRQTLDPNYYSGSKRSKKKKSVIIDLMKADNFRGEMEDAIKGAIELSEGKTTEVNLVKEDNNLNKKHHKKEKQTKSECRTNEENINDCSAKLVRKDYGVGRSLHSVDLPHEKNTDAESRLHGMEGLDVNEKTGEGGNMVKTASNPRGGSKKKRKKNRKFNGRANTSSHRAVASE
eukprot:jgi/Bigna1/70444/fgenesh1_pg.12_\